MSYLFPGLKMSFHLYRHRKLTEIVPVPEGLRELMADIAREVLRYQPNNMEAFIADYLEAMLLTRELYHIANQTIEDVMDSSCQIVEYLQKDGISQRQAESAVEVMNQEFKSHIEEMGEDEPLKELNIINRLIHECKLSIDQAQKASEIIESAWCHYYQRNKHHRSKIGPDIAKHVAVKNTLSIYSKSKAKQNNLSQQASAMKIDSRVSYENWQNPRFQRRETAAVKIQSWFRSQRFKKQFKEMIKAATKIQARFKGYKTRKELKRQKTSSGDATTTSKSYETSKSDTYKSPDEAAFAIQSWYRACKLRQEYKIEHRAATVIQAHFRGFKTRKNKPS